MDSAACGGAAESVGGVTPVLASGADQLLCCLGGFDDLLPFWQRDVGGVVQHGAMPLENAVKH
jgi:hypothetical protein